MLDCAVIGAGLAGLTAARDLVRRGLNVVVLEARGRVGGRLENVSLPDGQYVELGGQWIGTGHDQMSDLIDEFGLDVLGDSASGSFLVRLRGRLVVLPAPDEAAELTPFEIADLGSGLLRLRRLGQRFRDDPVWTRANHVWLSQDLDTWVAANMRTAGARDRFRTVYEMAFGHDSASATLQEGLMEVNSGPNLESMLAPNGGLNQQRIDGGAYRLAESMASGLGDIVRLGCEAIRVEHDDAGATVVLADGERVRARQVISTLPPKLAMTLEHDPPLPQWRIDEANKIASGNVIKACLVYERPFWRDAGLSGQSSTDEGAVRVTFDTTIEGENRRGLLMGFFEGADAQSLSKRSTFLRQRTFTEAAVRMFGPEAAKPVDYVERDWMAEPFTRGCDGAHFEPGAWTAVGPSLAEPEGVLHWAGTEYARRFNGYMEGAVQSGRRVAGTVAVQLA